MPRLPEYAWYPECISMFLKILAHPVFVNLNFHMPMIVDLSHPLVMLQGENGSGKSTLLHSIHYALRGDEIALSAPDLGDGAMGEGHDRRVLRGNDVVGEPFGLLQAIG